MLTKIFSFMLGLITYPLIKRIFEISTLSMPEYSGTIMIVFLIVFSLMALGVFFILRKIFGIFYFLGLVVGIIFGSRIF